MEWQLGFHLDTGSTITNLLRNTSQMTVDFARMLDGHVAWDPSQPPPMNQASGSGMWGSSCLAAKTFDFSPHRFCAICLGKSMAQLSKPPPYQKKQKKLKRLHIPVTQRSSVNVQATPRKVQLCKQKNAMLRWSHFPESIWATSWVSPTTGRFKGEVGWENSRIPRGRYMAKWVVEKNCY